MVTTRNQYTPKRGQSGSLVGNLSDTYFPKWNDPLGQLEDSVLRQSEGELYAGGIINTVGIRTGNLLTIPTYSTPVLSSGEWALVMTSAGFTGELPSGSVVGVLDDLEDVDTTTNPLIANQVLTYNGTEWTNRVLQSSQILTALGYNPWYAGNHPTTLTGYGILETDTLFNGRYADIEHSHSEYLGISASAISAAKLETVRTLWGQNFNGTANVTGSLTDVLDIYSTGIISSSKSTTGTLIIPTTPPNLSSGEWGLVMTSSGYTGELPSGSGAQYLGELGDVDLTQTPLALNQVLLYSGTGWINSTLGIPQITNLSTELLNRYTKAQSDARYPVLVSGSIPSGYLPSYVDDIIEVATYSALPYPGEGGKIYVTLDTNLTYRWGGTEYTEVSKSLALGETSATAYRGDRGKIAYDHSQITSGNPHGVSYSNILGTVPFYTKGESDLRYHPMSGSSDISFTAKKLKSSTLVIPTGSADLVAGEWGLVMTGAGFTGELPSGSGVQSLDDLSDVTIAAGTLTTGQTILYDGVDFKNTTLTFGYISGSLDASRISTSTVRRFVTDVQIGIWDAKQDALAFVENTEGKFLRDDNTFQVMEPPVGGFANNLYFSEIASDVSGYKTLSYTPDSAETLYNISVQSSEGVKTVGTYLYPSAVDVDIFPSGVWSFAFYGYVSSLVGVTQIGIQYFRRSTTGVETNLFTTWSHDIGNTTADYIKFDTTNPIYPLDPTDRMGARILVQTDHASPITVTFSIGDGYAAYLNNPNKIRHSQLRALNGDSNFLHITQTEKGNFFSAYSGSITSLGLTTTTLTLTKRDGSTLTANIPTWNQDTTGNATTATTLKTSRTLWGQSFNGGANVTGSLSSVGDITMTGSITGSVNITASGRIKSGTLVVPTGSPTLNSGEWGLVMTGAGFTGELPSGSGVQSLDDLSDVSVVTPTINQILQYNGTTWVNALLSSNHVITALGYTPQAKLIGTGVSSLVRVNTSGVVTYDDSTYLTGNQTITLSGIITGSGTTAITTAIADGALSIAKTSGLQTALDAKMATASYPDLVAIEALAGTSGFLKKTAADTWTLDTNTYLTAITKAQVEAVLTGTITSHNHNGTYALIGGATTQDFQVKALTMNGALSGATTIEATTSYKLGNNYIKSNGGYLEFQSLGNELCIGGTTGAMYINYRAASGGTPTLYRWQAGSSSLWADFMIGNLTANGAIEIIKSNDDMFRLQRSGVRTWRQGISAAGSFQITDLTAGLDRVTIDNSGNTIFSSTIQATTAKLTNLTDGYIPYHISDASGLGNSPMFTSGGLVGIGTSPVTMNNNNGSGYLVIGNGSGSLGMTIFSGAANSGRITFADSETGAGSYQGQISYNHSTNRLQFRNNNVSALEVSETGGVITYSTLEVAGITSLTNTTQSTAYTNGALVLSGGLGIAKDLYSNGNATFAGRVKSGTLVIPTGTTNLVAGEWGLVMTGAGFTGELPGEGGATSLDGLSDVTLGTLATSQILTYNGTTWVNALLSSNQVVTALGYTPQTKLIGTQDTSNGSLVRTNTAGTIYYDNNSYALTSSLSNYSLTSHTHSYITSTRYDSGDPKPNQLTVGLSFQFSYPDGGWYNALNMRSYDDPNYLATQIVSSANNPGSDTGYSYSLKYREGRNATWLGWKTILDSGNYSSYALPLYGGTISGGLTISHGGDLSLKAPVDSSDSGDLVFLDGSGTELHRLWSGSGTLNYRVSGGATHQLYHSGNSNLTTIDWSAKNLTLNGSISEATTGSFSGNVSASSFTSGGNAVIHAGNIGSQSVNYAASAGTSVLFDGYSIGAFLRKGNINTDYWNQGNTWAADWMGVLPDGLSGVYNYGTGITVNGSTASLQLYAPENSGGRSGDLWYRTGWAATKRDWLKVWHSGNLTNTLSNGYLPYWNGSSLVNSRLSASANHLYWNEYSSLSHAYFVLNKTSGYDGGVIWGLSGVNKFQQVITNSGDMDFYNYTYGGVAVRFTAGGNLFIGYTDRSEKLAVAGTIWTRDGVKFSNGGGGPATIYGSDVDGLLRISNNNQYTGDILFQSQNITQFALRQSGNVDIGWTSNPSLSHKLSVNGSGYFNGNLGLGTAADVRLSVSGDAHISNILYMGGTAGSYSSWGSRTLVTSGHYSVGANSFEFNNYGYGSTWGAHFSSYSYTFSNNATRSTIRQMSSLNIPTDFYMGVGSTDRWSITTRDSYDGYNLKFYSTSGIGYAAQFDWTSGIFTSYYGIVTPSIKIGANWEAIPNGSNELEFKYGTGMVAKIGTSGAITTPTLILNGHSLTIV